MTKAADEGRAERFVLYSFIPVYECYEATNNIPLSETGSQKEAKSQLILPLRFHNLYTIRALPSTKAIGRIITRPESKYGSETKRLKKSVSSRKRCTGSTVGCGDSLRFYHVLPNLGPRNDCKLTRPSTSEMFDNLSQ